MDEDFIHGDTRNCKLLSGLFALFVQFFLACVILSTLYGKWFFEQPRRPRKIWIFDSVKQICGSATGHAMNMLLAIMMTTNAGGEQCAWYCITSTLDTVAGLPLSYALLRLSENTILRDVPRSGAYYNETSNKIDYSIYIGQVFSWTATVIVTKLILATPLFFAHEQITDLGNVIFKPFDPYPRTVLIFVMLVWPAICNSIQFYVVAGFLKRNFSLETDSETEYLLQ